MKKLTGFIFILFLLLTAVSVPSAMATEADYTGSWFCALLDLGDGILLQEYEGQSLQEMIYFDLNADGTASVTSMDEEQTGTWSVMDNGILITVDGLPVPFIMENGMLVNHDEDIVMYFEKSYSEPSPTAVAFDFTGDWVCQFVDLGDGSKQSEYEGTSLPEAIHCTLSADGTAELSSFGTTQSGTWSATAVGITITMDGMNILFTYQDDQLINTEDGVTMYFGRPAEEPKSLGFHDLVGIGKADTSSQFQFAGTWNAITYEVSGMTLDLQTALPNGLAITLLQDGTGSVQLTADYAETLAWSTTADGIAISDNHLLFDPAWDAETETLTLSYAADVVRIGFQKNTIAIITPEPTPEIQSDALPLVYTCDYFSIAFPADWEENEYGTYSGDQYYSVQYDLNDEDGWGISDVSITASMEGVTDYRSEIASLQELAQANGKDALDELVIDGTLFQGLVYDDYWSQAEYYARIPEASVTLGVSVSAPEEIADVLPDIMDSIHFTVPIPYPPYSDPPLPENGIAFTPSPASVTTDSGTTLQAVWMPSDQSIIPHDLYNISMTCSNNLLYILTGQKLLPYNMDNGKLTASGEILVSDQTYSFISSDTHGSLYLTDGYYTLLTLVDSTATSLALDGYLAMHPDGVWGLSYSYSSDVHKITFTADGMATKPWHLTNLSDDTTRQDRFSTIDYIMITEDAIFIAGADASADNSTRITMFDLDGNELAVFGGIDWTDASSIGSVNGIAQTPNGIIVQDGFYTVYKLFALDGTFLGDIDCDELLGTNYAQPVAMSTSADSIYTMVSQERDDLSATELLVFKITGF